MKKHIILIIGVILTLASCGPKSGHFRIDGHLLNMNQATLLVYSPDGAITGVDTIKVEAGRFTYETPLAADGTLLLTFAGGTELPIFAEGGEEVSLDGNAFQIRTAEIKGTTLNRQYTEFREKTKDAKGAALRKEAAAFIRENPTSPISIHLIRQYFLGKEPAYAEALPLLKTMAAENKENGQISRLTRIAEAGKASTVGSRVATFTAQTIDGTTYTNANLSGKTTVILALASWTYSSADLLSAYRDETTDKPEKPQLLVISADPTKTEARTFMQRLEGSYPTVCDGLMLESPTLTRLGIPSIPFYLIIDRQGKITHRGTSAENLRRDMGKL